MKRLSEFLEEVKGDKDSLVVFASEVKCLEAVKRNGDALRYVKEQTEAVCLEAVKEDGYALQYVDIRIFEVDIEIIGR